MQIDFQKKLVKYQDRRGKHKIQKLRYIKLVSETVKHIISNNDKRLSNNDIKEICIKVYKKYDKLKHVRVRNELSQGVTQNKINNELQRIYTDAGLSKDALKPLLESIKLWIDEKKDVTNALKLVDRIESANNLVQKQSISARTTETTDFSKIGRDGQPAQKVTKTLEITTKSDKSEDNIDSNNAPGSLESPDNEPPTTTI